MCLVEHRASPVRRYVKICTREGFQEGFLEEVTPQLSLLVCKSWQRGRDISGRWDIVSKQSRLCAGWEAAETVSTPHCVGGGELWVTSEANPGDPAWSSQAMCPPGHVQIALGAETLPVAGANGSL